MNKKHSNIFLITVLSSIIILILGIFYKSKEDVLLEDISGNRSELGEVIITYQKRKGLFQTNEINISKDKIWSKYFVKEGSDGITLNEKNLDNRELFKYISTENEVCEDEVEIATVSLMNTYITDNQSEMTACIEVKNKKTKVTIYYEIPVDNNIDTKGNTDYTVIPIKDKDNIYLTVLSSVYDEGDESKEGYNYKETYLSLYKINLSNEICKLILSSSYDGNEMYIDSNVGFSRGNISYFIINKKKENEYRNILFGFDVKTKRIIELDLGPKQYEINDYLVDNNNLLLSCTSKENDEILKTILINLDKNKITNENQVNLNTENRKRVLDMKMSDNKTILLMGQDEGDDVYEQSDDIQKNYFIYVVDSNTKEILYEGKITEKIMYNIKLGIIENNK